MKSRNYGFFCGKCKLYDSADPAIIKAEPCIPIAADSDDEAKSPRPDHAKIRSRVRIRLALDEEQKLLERLVEQKMAVAMEAEKHAEAAAAWDHPKVLTGSFLVRYVYVAKVQCHKLFVNI